MEIEICIIPENETEIELLKKLELEKARVSVKVGTDKLIDSPSML